MTGANTKQEAIQLQNDILQLLKKGGFHLRKWHSNDSALLEEISTDDKEDDSLQITEDIKALGLRWNPKKDEFHFKIPVFENMTLTKRQLLSNIASIFDPLQWLAPVMIKSKILMKNVWSDGTEWDETPSKEIISEWSQFEAELSALEEIRIPRWNHYGPDSKIELHGFCDASDEAYAAVVYSKCICPKGKATISLLCAKTKVCPAKAKLTTPELELNGAVLLANLLQQTIVALNIYKPKIYAWSDSKITLDRLKLCPSTLETFVANRITKIQRISNDEWCWQHVKGDINPADCASRGLSPKELLNFKLWWNGPSFLLRASEQSIVTYSATNYNGDANFDLMERYSDFGRLVRITAYCLRFYNNLKSKSKDRKLNGFLTAVELANSERTIIKVIQQKEFAKEIAELPNPKGKLRNLSPFIDSYGILRVGGRLRNADITEEYKYPILLPKHHVTYIIVREVHKRTLHGGVALVRNYLRMKYWIIDDQKVIRYEIHRCIICHKYSKDRKNQIMGDLPSVRVNPANAFIYSGVDYAGPFYTRMAKGRGSSKLKGYIAVFVCMVTKAIHLELVSDLTTEAFLAAFKRFVGRRGLCKEIYSDNGTNFVGASKLLDSDIKDAIIKSTSNIAKITAKDDITWKFIPVATPHFGGLWEAGVKSVKHHIKRIFDEADIIPTFEEFSTVLVQIEACLNSRPITPMSSDPNDYQALTPGHFLIGRPLISVPEPDYKNESLHSRWRKLKDLHQLFWDRWSTEYLHTLQRKSKWTTEQQNPQKGQLVLLKQSNIPPSMWPLARIHELKPGADNKVRVVIVRHDGNKLKEVSTVNICPLPIDVSIDQPENLQIETQQLDSNKANKVKNINSHSKTKIVHKRKLVNNHEGTPSSRANPVAPTLTGRQKKKRRIAPCLWARSLLSTILTFMMFLSALASNDTKHRYEIIKPDSGYYIENLGKSQVLRGNLRLEIPFPMADILSDEKNVLHTFDKTNRICEDTKEMVQITHCDVLLKHLKAKQLRISRQIEQLKTFVPSRSKRGILGKFLTTVFGVNDEVYENIDNLDKNQRMLLHLTSQQHLQVSTSLQQMNNATKNKLEQFSKKIDQLVGIMNGMKPWYKSIDDNKISIQVISAYLTASDYYNEVEFKYQNLVNAMYGQANIMHFLPTNTILDVIDQVSEKLGPLFQIIHIPQKRIDVSKSTDCLEVHGYFYITERYSYDLIHVSAIPFKASPHEFITPIIKTPTLAINFNQHLYFEMEDDQFRNCILTSDIYLCSPSVIANINTKPNCVIDEVYQRFNKSGCPMSAVENTQLLWKQLMMPNTWSFATDTPTLASITCNGVREEELLTDVGILRLKGNCLIQTDHYTLRSTFDEQRRVLSTFSKKIQLPKMESLAQQKLHVIDLPKIGQQMFEPLPPGTFTDEVPRMHTLAIHTAAASGTTTIIAVVLIVVFILKKRKTRKLRTSSDEMTLSERFNRIFANQKIDSVNTTDNEAGISSVV